MVSCLLNQKNLQCFQLQIFHFKLNVYNTIWQEVLP